MAQEEFRAGRLEKEFGALPPWGDHAISALFGDDGRTRTVTVHCPNCEFSADLDLSFGQDLAHGMRKAHTAFKSFVPESCAAARDLYLVTEVMES